ncbi:Aste57867_18165 [Aphanomyces stellatus]|uniref:Aste57867_18165 protein n=1 Tax=Aphanomyces stellatus TaxID=120398 RepID=A0A485L9C3_9STRA|nr:hypothetical protein As57867_018103 [Aphanomyces stellatus]VFT94903.1 Aste57867_18165 [Aphanomyces stellatus]
MLRPASLLGFLVGMAAAGLAPSGLNYGFTDCTNNLRTLFFYSPTTQSCTVNSTFSLPPPVPNLDCTVSCRRGQFLGADFTNPSAPVSGCEKCPFGSYSLGGGKLYSAMMKTWQPLAPLPPVFDSQCYARDVTSGNWVANCMPWTVDPSGGWIMSGNNSKILANYNADRLYSLLRLVATYVRPGNITFQYRVDAEPTYDGVTFMIDGVVAMMPVATTNGWSEMNFPVNAGSHVFVWKYIKNDQVDWGADQAAIRTIELTGTSYSDTACMPCGGDLTRRNRFQCRLCDANQYAASTDPTQPFTCNPCPANTYAPPGSFGVAACNPSRPCGMQDLAVFYTPCQLNVRNVSRVWAQPMTCNASLADPSVYPMNDTNIECGDCTDGYYPDSNGVCQTCPDGQVINASGSWSYSMTSSDSENATSVVSTGENAVISLCTKCPAGTIMVRSQIYGTITRRGWSLWPAIVDNGTAVRNGWKLTEPGITRDATLSPLWLPSTSLLFNTTQLNRGQLEINYTLSGIPAVGSGDSASLSLFVNDAPISLPHVADNGTFYVEIPTPLRLDGNNTLAVNFVWTTSSAAVDKVANFLLRSIEIIGTSTGGSGLCDSCPTGYAPNANQSSCTMCPAGTAATVQSDGGLACTTCPANTFAYAGSALCTPCGTNTFSVAGSTVCQTKQLLIDSTTSLMYNLTALQAMVDPLVDLDVNSGFLPATPITVTAPFALNSQTAMAFGIFRPVVANVPPQYIIGASQLNNTATLQVGSPQSYAVGLAMANARDAGSNFLYNANNFGLVQCTIPPRFNLFNAGGKIDISVLPAPGIRATYSLGSLCNASATLSAAFYTTTVDYLCDPAQTGPTKPVLVGSTSCNTQLTWTTAAACPLCTQSLFTPTKSACNLLGNQTITMVPSVPCVGGSQPTQIVTVQTCASFTLNQQTAGIAAGVVFLIIVLIFGLIVGLIIVYRKYKATLVEFLYLKGQANNHELLESGSTRSADGAFEFQQKPNTVVSPEASGVDEEKDEEEDVDIKPKANVVM